MIVCERTVPTLRAVRLRLCRRWLGERQCDDGAMFQSNPQCDWGDNLNVLIPPARCSVQTGANIPPVPSPQYYPAGYI